MATPNPHSDADPDAPVDTTPSDAGLSTTGLSAGDIENEMPPPSDEAIEAELEAERIDQVSDGDAV